MFLLQFDASIILSDISFNIILVRMTTNSENQKVKMSKHARTSPGGDKIFQLWICQW